MSEPTKKQIEYAKLIAKNLGYKGCRNCVHQIAPLRACEWMEHGGDGVVHLICPRWDRKGEKNETN